MTNKDPKAKEGMRIRLITMMDDPNPIEPGTEGTIRLVDGMGIIHVNWDNGRTLGIIPDVDRYQLIEDSSGSSEIKAAIRKTPSSVNKSMPKSTKVPSSINKSLSSSGIKTNQTSKNFKSANIKDVKVENEEEELDEMTAAAGGASTGAYTGQAWGSGPLNPKKEVNETTRTNNTDNTDYSTPLHFIDKDKDGWIFDDVPFWEGGEIVDITAKIKTNWFDEKFVTPEELGKAKKLDKTKKLNKEDLMRLVKTKINESKKIEVDLEKGDEILTGKFKNRKDTVKKIGNNKEKQPTVNDKPMLKFKIPKLMPEEEAIEETTTFSSVWGVNGPPVGPAFAAKKGDWKMIKRPIWKGGTIVQTDLNSGIMNPINEVKIKDVNSLQVGKKYKLLIPNYDEGGTEEINVEVIKKDKTGYVFKDLDNSITFKRTYQHLKSEEIISEVNKVKFVKDGKYVKIKDKCVKYNNGPHCSQGAIDDPLILSDDTIKNIQEISKKTGKPFNEVYRIVMEQMKLR